MVFEHRMAAARGRGISADQEAAIAKALAGKKISEAEAGALFAASLYASEQQSGQAVAALKAAAETAKMKGGNRE